MDRIVRRLAATLLLATAFAIAGLATPATAQFSVSGERVTDVDGRVHRLGVEPSVRPFALVFLDTSCPISNRYAPRLNELAAAAGARGVAFFGVISTPDVSAAKAREYRDEYELAFPILFDASGDLALRMRPTHVPEVFVVGADDALQYRGRIDDRFEAVGRPRANVSSHDLFAAIEAAAAGATPKTVRTEPVGCVFEAWDADLADYQVTYHRDIAPILNAHCAECHREGDIGPFALADYRSAKRRAKMIAKVCDARVMPPWRAEKGFGHFRSERHLSTRQLAVLQAWAQAGAPEGDVADALPVVPVAKTKWRLGDPDLVVSMPVEYRIPADGNDIYRYFVIPNELAKHTDVVAIDVRPGDPTVVHHCIVYLDRTGRARRLDARDDEAGFSVFGNGGSFGESLTTSTIGGWAPGNQPHRLPGGTAMQLRRGGDFVLEVHYHPTGKKTSDKTEVGIYFAKKPVERYVASVVIGTQRIDIEPGDADYRRRVWMDLPVDVDLIAVTPHMHMIGKTVDAFATLPSGDKKPLIRIDRWDFRWQDTYFYRRPMRLPKGTRIEARFSFDNSADNPANPSSPPIRVKEGWQTTDEMCLIYLTVVPDKRRDVSKLHRAMFQSFMRPGR